jgi:hypothetical protein
MTNDAGQNSTRRQQQRLRSTLENRLRSYSRAAQGSSRAIAAAMASLLIGPQLSESQIVYTPLNEPLIGGQGLFVHPIDFNHDGTPELVIAQYGVDCYRSSGTFSLGTRLYAFAYASVQLLDIKEHFRTFALAEKLGKLIGPSDAFQPYFARMAYESFIRHNSSVGHNYKGGRWLPSTDRYLGVKFVLGRETHYGWVRISVKTPALGIITGYAYESTPNKPIKAGFKTYADAGSAGSDDSESVPLTLGILATGSPRSKFCQATRPGKFSAHSEALSPFFPFREQHSFFHMLISLDLAFSKVHAQGIVTNVPLIT